MKESYVSKNAYDRIAVENEEESLFIIKVIKISLMRVIGYVISYVMYWINNLIWKMPAHPEKIIWVDPDEIVRSIEFSKIVSQRRYYLNGIIKDGDWDKGTYTVYHLHDRLFEAFKRRFFEGYCYLDTTYFQQKDLPESSLKALADKYKRRYDYIYSEIKKEGFSLPSSVLDYMEEFKIGISSKGEFLFMTGKHRLGIAKLMGEDFKMPVKVSYRHTEWQAYRDQLYTDLKTGKISDEDIMNLNHPDLLDLVEPRKEEIMKEPVEV